MPKGFGEASSKPHFLGHRERLRERFREAGPEALPDYELLEMIAQSSLKEEVYLDQKI